MNKNCLLCGVGGQGVVLASKLIAYAAMEKGMEVRTSETIGMSQRGGSVASHVRMGQEIYSPMIPRHSADVILAFEPAEAVRSLSYLKKGGVVVVNKKAVKPVTAALSRSCYDGGEMICYLRKQAERLYVVDGEAVCRKVGSPKLLNVALLGAALVRGFHDISLTDMERQLSVTLKPQFTAMNLKALKMGADLAGVRLSEK